MYRNDENADRMRFSSSAHTNCHSDSMPKLYRLRRTSLRRLVLVSLIAIVTSSFFANTWAASISRTSAEKKLCEASSASSERMSSSESNYSPLFSSVISQCNTTIDKAKHLAEKWFYRELGKEGYSSYIGEFKGELVQEIPKVIHTPTTPQVLAELDEKATLDKLYKDLILVRNAVIERETVANKKYESDREIFSDLHTEIGQIIEELSHVLRNFDVEIPADSGPNPVRHENSEETTERKRRNWRIFHDYIILVEYTYDIMKYLDKKYCSTA